MNFFDFYGAIKDAAGLAQKADNIDLYRKLLDLSSEALELQAEVAKLKAENEELKRKRDLSSKIIRHNEPVITLQAEEPKLYYCSHCWDSEQLLIQLSCNTSGKFTCPHCQTHGVYDNSLREQNKSIYGSYIRY